MEPVLILPDGSVDLIWDGTTVFVAGPDRTAAMASPASGSVLSGVRLAAGTAAGLLKLPLHAIADQRVALESLWGVQGRTWQHRLEDGADPLHTLHTLCQQHTTSQDQQMAWLFDQLAVRSVGCRQADAACRADPIAGHQRALIAPPLPGRIRLRQQDLGTDSSVAAFSAYRPPAPHVDRRCAGRRLWRCATSSARCTPAQRPEPARVGTAARVLSWPFSPSHVHAPIACCASIPGARHDRQRATAPH